MRTFVAIAIPESVRASLTAVQRELLAQLTKGAARPVRPEQLHLTLQFLGEVDDGQVDGLTIALRAGLEQCAAPRLICERLGCFPDLVYPRVVWAWVHDVAGRLDEIAKRVAKATETFIAAQDAKPFTGHITLLRTPKIRRPDIRALARFVESTADRVFGDWLAVEVLLMSSDLTPLGPRYATLAAIPLEKT